MIYFYNYKYKKYNFTIVADDKNILQVTFGSVNFDGAREMETPLIRKTINQLNEYFDGQRKCFDLPLNPKCTPFQKKVLENLINVPYGKTISYKELAELSGSPKASRAVGLANRNNPIAIIIPCHRVIGTNGKLTGYAGGLELKKELLELELSGLPAECVIK